MGEPSGYAATYYPGTPNVAEAARVTLAVSQENTGVSFGLIATRLVRVSGQVLTSTGSPATNGMVLLVPAGANGRPAIGGAAGRRRQSHRSDRGFRLAERGARPVSGAGAIAAGATSRSRAWI